MWSISRKLGLLLLLSCVAFAQNAVNIDTGVKGSRWPAFGTDSGAANAYVVTTVAPLGPGLRTGSKIIFFAIHANSGASTLNVDSVGVKSIKKSVSTALASGDILLNGLVEVVYDGTNFQCLSCGGSGGGGSGTVTSVATTTPISGGTITTTGTISCPTCAIGPGSSTTNHLAKFSGTDGLTLADGGAIPAGTVTSIATTSPIGGGTITGTGTVTCTTCVVASSPGAGVAHFAGSTQTVTSSAVSLTADVSGILPIANGGSATATPAIVAGTNVTVSGSWPNQTINATASGGGSTIIGGSPYATPVTVSPAISYTAMAYWFSADCIYLSDGTTCAMPSNGTDITLWWDRSGMLQFFEENSAGCTLTSTVAAINNQPAVAFNGTCGKYALFNFFSNNVTWNTVGFTIFAVAQNTLSSGSGGMVSGPGTGDVEYRMNFGTSTEELLRQNAATLGKDSQASDTNWHQMNVTCGIGALANSGANTTPQFRIDRAASTTVSGAACSGYTSGVSAMTRLGYNAAGNTEIFKGGIAEIILYKRVLSSTEITAVESYLHTKYGI